MKIPIFLSARPKFATERSAIIRIPSGQWNIISDNNDSQIVIRMSDVPLTILEKEKMPIPCMIVGPCYLLAEIIFKGTEPHISVFAEKAA